LVVFGCAATLLASVQLSQAATASATPTDYDALRAKWDTVLTGGSNYNPGNPYYVGIINRITTTAQTDWSTLNTAQSRTYLWPDLQTPATSAQLTEAYTRLEAMALAYSTTGSSLHANQSLKTATIAALDWMYTNRYNPTKSQTGNWWDWQIGVPLQLNNATTLLYSDLTQAEITNYMRAVDHFTPSVTYTGANRSWQVIIVGLRGVLVQDTTKISAARDGLRVLFNYVQSSDGFYTDGSFIQHNRYSYNGGYGAALLADVADTVYLLQNSPWQVTDPNVSHLYQWVYAGFEPLMYNGLMMDMTMGRIISRYNFQDQVIGHQVLYAILRLSQFAPPADTVMFKSMVKQWAEPDTTHSYFNDATLNTAILANHILNDPSVPALGGQTSDNQYNNMARAVHQRPTFAYGLSMFSNRIANYEAMNTENLKGWHTADGMTYLYNGDDSQFNDAFWPTVDSTRLPGTTVESGTTVSANVISDQSWVGGASLGGYGASGMAMHTPGQTLKARKSWFMFDDEIVALGSGIMETAPDNKHVETIVENRKLSSPSANVLTVNGTRTSTGQWAQTFNNVRWAQLSGSNTDSDIGYYFPTPTSVSAQRQARSGSWFDIDKTAPFIDTNTYTRTYQSLWFDHGVNPSSGAYSYVLLPGKSAAQTSAYAAQPDIAILQNNSNAQGVIDRQSHVTAANFWADATQHIGDITSNKKTSILVKEDTDGGIKFSAADPMFSTNGTLNVEIAKAGGQASGEDPAITVTQLTPTIKMSINLANLRGRSVKVNFAPPVVVSN
jgi:hyaluronate lyase